MTAPPQKTKAAPEFDRHDPLVRFQLLTVSTYSGVQKAYIKHILVGESRLIKVVETIGECRLVKLSIQDQSACPTQFIRGRECIREP